MLSLLRLSGTEPNRCEEGGPVALRRGFSAGETGYDGNESEKAWRRRCRMASRMTLAPHELPIHALRTNEALPIRHGIPDFFKAPAAVHPARCNCYGRSRLMRPNVLFLRWPSLKRPGRFPPTARILKVRFRASPRRSSASRGGVHQWVLSVRFYPLEHDRV